MADAVKELVIKITRVVDPAGEAASKAAHQAERKRIADDVAAVRAAEKEKADAAKQASKAVAASAKERLATTKGVVDESVKLERELLAEGKRLAAEKARREKQDARNAIESSKLAFAERKKLLDEASKAEAKAAKAREAEAAAMNKALLGAAGLGASVIGQMDSAFKKVAASALEATGKAIEYRKALIELASLRGNAGDTTPEIRKNAAIAAQTGLPLSGVSNLTTKAYAGASSFLDQPGGAKGLMSPEEYAKSVVTAGRFGAVMGGDPGAYGEAAALIPVLAGKRIDSGQFESELTRYDKMATAAGVANPALLFGAMQKNVGYASSGVLSGAELGGLTAGYSQTSGAERAAERVQQAISAVSAGLVKDRGGNIADEFKDQAGTTADYFKRLGITQAMGTMGRLGTIAADINAQKAANKDFNANEYLALQGFGNEGSRAALMEFAGNVGSGRYGKSIEPLITQKFQPGAVDARFQDAMRFDPAIRQGMVDAGGQLADVALGDRGSIKNQARRMAFESLRARGQTRGTFEEYSAPLGVTDLWNLNRIGVGGVNTRTLDEEAAKLYAAQAKRLGIPTSHVENGRVVTIADELTKGYAGTFGIGRSVEMEDRLFNAMGGRMQAAGGSPVPGIDKIAAIAEAQLKATQEQTAAIREQTRAVQANRPNGGVPVPVPSKPPVGPQRIGG